MIELPKSKVVVRYPHDPNNLSTIYISVGGGLAQRQWVPAYRDTINGIRVVWIRTTRVNASVVWIKDADGEYQVPVEDILSYRSGS